MADLVRRPELGNVLYARHDGGADAEGVGPGQQVVPVADE